MMLRKKIAVALLSTLTMVGCVSEKQGGDLVKVGDPVPAFTVTGGSSEGTRTFSQADFVGKRSMIIFFATWCPDCRRELPIVHEAWLKLRNRPDFQLVAISREEAAETVSTYWSSTSEIKPLPFDAMPWWLDGDRSAFRTFADSTIPRVYFVDTRGEIATVAVETFELTADKIVELIVGLK